MVVTIHMDSGNTYVFEDGGYYKVSPPYLVVKETSRGDTLGHISLDNMECVYKDDAEVTIGGNTNMR